MAVGKVHLVGAGPGHPDLLTIKAAALLKTADVVVYDRLIQPGVLDLAKPEAERVFMGKHLGGPDAAQREINELLVEKARAGKMVVRLKGGDPFMFGRGGEEAAYLVAHAIPFEVVPGVSSAMAAPLRALIPVTHRGVAACVAFATGHEAEEEGTRLDWGALARIPTVVFMMGVGNVRQISTRLIEGGRAGSTPVAIVQQAYWDDERVVTSTLAAVADDVDRLGIRPPATLVVGEVVRLRATLRGSES
jgi:uroporphyrin-III C-methyltransferase